MMLNTTEVSKVVKEAAKRHGLLDMEYVDNYLYLWVKFCTFGEEI